jgi:hypothetical protein
MGEWRKGHGGLVGRLILEVGGANRKKGRGKILVWIGEGEPHSSAK